MYPSRTSPESAEVIAGVVVAVPFRGRTDRAFRGAGIANSVAPGKGTLNDMRAITARDRDAGIDGLTLTDMPYPRAALNDVIVQVHAAGFTRGELDWPHL